MRPQPLGTSRVTRTPYLLVAPLTVVLIVFFGIPLVLVVVVSFFDLDKFDIIPTFVLTNYAEVFGSSLTYALYAKTITYALIVWAITLVIGFTVSYFLVFHVRSVLVQMALGVLTILTFKDLLPVTGHLLFAALLLADLVSLLALTRPAEWPQPAREAVGAAA